MLYTRNAYSSPLLISHFGAQCTKRDCKILTEPIGFIGYLHCLYPELLGLGEYLLLEDIHEEDVDKEEKEDILL